MFTKEIHGTPTEAALLTIGCFLIVSGVDFTVMDHLWSVIVGNLMMIAGIRWTFRVATDRAYHHGSDDE